MKRALTRKNAQFCALCVAGMLATFKVAIADTAELQAIQDMFKDSYASAVNSEDATEFADLFSENGIRIPPNRPPESTRDGIKSGVEKVFAKFDFNVDVAVEDIELEGKFAWASIRAFGERTERESKKLFPVNVRYVVVMMKGNGGWEIFRQSWYPIK